MIKTAVILGYGDRGRVYGNYTINFPGQLKITAVVEPIKARLSTAQKLFNLPNEMCFSDFESFLKKGKIADCVINATMDTLHIATTLPILELGYDILLEKPVCSNAVELHEIERAAKKSKRLLMICHVLRYAPFYKKIKELVLSGVVGEIIHIQTDEHVAYNHASAAFIRGKWKNEKECGSSMLLQKCCHDLDLIAWFNNSHAKRVSSFGGRNFIVKEKAPINSGTRCLTDCPLVDECHFSAKKISVQKDIFPQYTCECIPKYFRDVTQEEKLESLKTNNPHGECAYKTNATVVDHQTLILEFENGSTATHSMVCGACRGDRTIHILGTNGEIEGRLSENIIKVFSAYNPPQSINVNDLIAASDNHMGGDTELMCDFVKMLNGENPSISCTSISDSIIGHLTVFKADESRQTGKTKNIH